MSCGDNEKKATSEADIKADPSNRKIKRKMRPLNEAKLLNREVWEYNMRYREGGSGSNALYFVTKYR
jgi:hypothetical protein